MALYLAGPMTFGMAGGGAGVGPLPEFEHKSDGTPGRALLVLRGLPGAGARKLLDPNVALTFRALRQMLVAGPGMADAFARIDEVSAGTGGVQLQRRLS